MSKAKQQSQTFSLSNFDILSVNNVVFHVLLLYLVIFRYLCVFSAFIFAQEKLQKVEE